MNLVNPRALGPTSASVVPVQHHSRQRLRSVVVTTRLLLASLLLATPSFANTDRQGWTEGFNNNFGITANAVPGGVAVVDIGPEVLPSPTVHWTIPAAIKKSIAARRTRVLVQKNAGRWLAVIGLPLHLSPGEYTLEVVSTYPRTQNFSVSGKAYPVQNLIIANKRKVNPNPQDEARINKESSIMAIARETHSENFLAKPFVIPTIGRVSSKFGLRRVYNGEPRSPHAGLDIAAIEGTAIIAAARGKVIEAGDFFFNGQSVFVDHGQGLISLYSHMSRIAVTAGQTVEAGERLGDVGQTGRVTGAHLHWSVALNGVWIDPLLLLAPGLNADQGQ